MAVTKFSVIILAAGKGTRMKSPLPKVLHPVAGTPMIHKVIDAVRGAGAEEIRLVVGYGEALVRQVVEPLGCICYPQTNQWGTADAVRAADPTSLAEHVLILNGDHPLIRASDIQHILEEFATSKAELSVVTATVRDPGSLGRIVRHKGDLRAIVEVQDASQDTLNIREVNSGIYVMKAEILHEYLPQIKNHNAKNEFYLTDLISICLEAGEKVTAIEAPKTVAFGVNTQIELARASKTLFKRKVEALMDEGVVVIDPTQTYIEDEVQIGAATVIYPGVYLRGKTVIGSYCVLEPNTYVAHSRIADSVQIKAGCYIDNSVIHGKVKMGPYAHMRPESEIGEEAHVGNFVEFKKVKFGARSKANHLTYLGDAEVGTDSNIGCGTITCNYAVDRKKYRTRIGNHVFVGSDSQFVAPIEVGDGAVIGSGSTITKNVPAGALAVARSRQMIKEDYTPQAATPKSQEPEA
jgi:bifunctional UDP-N-acetylglucosamine pyrophosphorylase/glucosamine-1-phosphate N-acetyltransferase